jgi:hypothetical protein
MGGDLLGASKQDINSTVSSFLEQLPGFRNRKMIAVVMELSAEFICIIHFSLHNSIRIKAIMYGGLNPTP